MAGGLKIAEILLPKAIAFAKDAQMALRDDGAGDVAKDLGDQIDGLSRILARVKGHPSRVLKQAEASANA